MIDKNSIIECVSESLLKADTYCADLDTIGSMLDECMSEVERRVGNGFEIEKINISCEKEASRITKYLCKFREGGSIALFSHKYDSSYDYNYYLKSFYIDDFVMLSNLAEFENFLKGIMSSGSTGAIIRRLQGENKPNMSGEG